MPERCSSWISGLARCGHPAKVERDGKWYCGIHDPERKKARDARRAEIYGAEAEHHDAMKAVGQAEAALIEECLASEHDRDRPKWLAGPVNAVRHACAAAKRSRIRLAELKGVKP